MSKQKNYEGWRTFPHSNSTRKLIVRDKEDREEALLYTTNYRQLRNGNNPNGPESPDLWYDVYVYRKHITKPKEKDHNDRATIRRSLPEPAMDTADETDKNAGNKNRAIR